MPFHEYSGRSVNQAETSVSPIHEKHKTMGRSTIAAILVVCLVAGVTAGYATAASTIFEPQLAKLQKELSMTKDELSSLNVNFGSLKSSYDQLKNGYDQLNTSYSGLSLTYLKLLSDYSGLDSAYSKLGKDHSDLASYYKSLSSNVTELYNLLYSYSRIPDAFSRTLNLEEVRKTSPAVSSATGSSTDSWSSYQMIYNYITSNIKYARDIDMPYLHTYWHVNLEGCDYITKFAVTTCRNYVQTPSLTLEIKQGDCDDQAVLTYAMVKYYMRFVYNTEYLLYIGHVEFSSGDAHLTAILPVQGGQLCIIDPAGKYLTSRSGVITSKQALLELQAYSDYWLREAGPITHMELYSVDVTDGSYKLAGEGNISQVAAIFK